MRFRRTELVQHGNLTAAAQQLLEDTPQPGEFLEALQGGGLEEDAVRALALMLPHRQSIWWGCLATRLLPDINTRTAELAALEVSENWVQSQSAADAEKAEKLASKCDRGKGASWVAQATHWAGPTLAPRGQPEVRPEPFLTGVAMRNALLLLGLDPALAKPQPLAVWLPIGLALKAGENGKEAQQQVRENLAQN